MNEGFERTPGIASGRVRGYGAASDPQAGKDQTLRRLLYIIVSHPGDTTRLHTRLWTKVVAA